VQVAYEIATRTGGDPGYPGLFGPAEPAAAAQARRLGVLETAGWAVASRGAKEAMADALIRFKAAGIELITRQSHARLAAVEAAIAQSAGALHADQQLGNRAGRSIPIARATRASSAASCSRASLMPSDDARRLSK